MVLRYLITFSETIQPASFDMGNIRLTTGTRYDPQATVYALIQVTDTIWVAAVRPRVASGFIGITLDMSSVLDLAGNHGDGEVEAPRYNISVFGSRVRNWILY